ncbi:hypothetical protein Emag_006550 [Eimeria magna]
MDALGNVGYAEEVSDATAGCSTQVQPDYHAGAAGGAPAASAPVGRAGGTPEKESDDSGTEGVPSSVHAQRLGVDIPLDPEEEELTFQSARIFKIENLQSMKKLKIEGLSTLTELRLLELGSNRIREIEGLEKLTQLTDLWLGKNKITDMKLPPLPQLERISLQSNRLEAWSVSFFEQCPKVRELYLSHNNLPSPPKEISLQTELTVLDLGCNRVEEVEAVAPLSKLQDLWLNDNKLDTIEKCCCLKDLPELETLYLERNPLQANLGPGYRQAVTDVLPRLSQLDALLLHTSVKVVQHPEKAECCRPPDLTAAHRQPQPLGRRLAGLPVFHALHEEAACGPRGGCPLGNEPFVLEGSSGDACSHEVT